MNWVDHLFQDLRSATRNLRRFPVASLVAILSLAAGIGATTVTLTIRDVVFRKPPAAYAHPERLSVVQVGSLRDPIRGPIGSAVPVALYLKWRDHLGSSIAASVSRGDQTVRTADRTETLRERAVSPELFPVLGVQPATGASFLQLPAAVDGPAPAILSARAWQQLFDGRADAIGSTFWIDDRPHTVVGVMPRNFWFAEMDSPIWTVLDVRALMPDATVNVVTRRPPGISQAMLEARLQAGLAEYASELPAGQRQLMVKASGVEGTPIGHQMSFALPYVLGTAVLLTLLIACANVAILMIAQWTAREQEIAIRASIGATRGRIVRSLLTESVLVALCGGALGICATLAMRGWIVYTSGGGELFFALAIDPIIFAKTAAISLLTGIVAGIMPALYETRRLHLNPLRTVASSDAVRQRWRHSLVVLEITVTIALLVVTSAMIEGYWRTIHGQVGYATAPLMTARVENPGGVPTRQLLEALAQMPGIASAAASTSVPMPAAGARVPVTASAAGAEPIVAERGDITEGFFGTLGVPMRTGRAFSAADTAGSRTAIVNEILSRQLFQDRTAVGARIWVGGVPYDVVGVVADYANSPYRSALPQPRVFVPLAADASNLRHMSFLIRTAGDPSSLGAAGTPGDAFGRRGHGICPRRDHGPGHRDHGAGDDRRHGTARPARHNRLDVDDGGDLRRAGIRDRASRQRTGGAHRRRRQPARRRRPGRGAHASAGGHRNGVWRGADVRARAARALGWRRRQHMGSIAAGLSLASRHARGHRGAGDMDPVAAGAGNRSGRVAAGAVESFPGILPPEGGNHGVFT